MRFKQSGTIITAILFGITLLTNNAFADTLSTNPCNGIFSLVDRPSKSDSACVVPDDEVVLEGGYTYLDLSGNDATGENYPDAELRIGLPSSNELTMLLPNFNTQTIFPHAGFSAPVVGIKHQFGYTSHWVGAVEGLVTLPTCSDAFGSDGTGGAFNAIATYSFNSTLSATAMLGVATQTLSTLANGGRYNSINPDALISYDINDALESYAEVYGQNHTAPDQGSGYDADGGFLFLVARNTEVDIEIAQRLNGNLGGFNHYVGAGIGMLFR